MRFDCEKLVEASATDCKLKIICDSLRIITEQQCEECSGDVDVATNFKPGKQPLTPYVS